MVECLNFKNSYFSLNLQTPASVSIQVYGYKHKNYYYK